MWWYKIQNITVHVQTVEYLYQFLPALQRVSYCLNNVAEHSEQVKLSAHVLQPATQAVIDKMCIDWLSKKL